MFRFKTMLFIIGAIILVVGVFIWATEPFFNKMFYKNDVISYEGVVVDYGCYRTPTDDRTYTYHLVVDVDGNRVNVQYISPIFNNIKDGQKVTVYEVNGYRSLDSEQVFDTHRNEVPGRLMTMIGGVLMIMSVTRLGKYNWLKHMMNS